MMSPGLQRQIAEQEEAEAREAAKEARERAARAQLWQERSLQAAIAQAVLDGESVNPRQAMQGRGIGHQPHEFVAMMAAVQDAEDEREAAREHAEYLAWKRDRGESMQGDMTAPTHEEAEANRLDAARSAKYREHISQRQVTLDQARREAAAISARGDRQVLGAVATAFRLESGSDNHAGYAG